MAHGGRGGGGGGGELTPDWYCKHCKYERGARVGMPCITFGSKRSCFCCGGDKSKVFLGHARGEEGLARRRQPSGPAAAGGQSAGGGNSTAMQKELGRLREELKSLRATAKAGRGATEVAKAAGESGEDGEDEKIRKELDHYDTELRAMRGIDSPSQVVLDTIAALEAQKQAKLDSYKKNV